MRVLVEERAKVVVQESLELASMVSALEAVNAVQPVLVAPF